MIHYNSSAAGGEEKIKTCVSVRGDEAGRHGAAERTGEEREEKERGDNGNVGLNSSTAAAFWLKNMKAQTLIWFPGVLASKDEHI